MDAKNNPPEKAEDTSAKLSPEELKALKAAQKRYFFYALIAGLVLLVLGVYAGQNFARSTSGDMMPVTTVSDHFHGVSEC
ncbi:hypothetical protein [Arcanobacterium pinnipediorum]|uniref:Uncharacterized protein n=1 Tax=Arcanobacterium pinnipediorum TaxID=1503041 RepID=A0ABY5AIZ5_9ACTO|nr:hypothetical protein [Arcanobacterium pinnipediorum]USR80062.1 hypothetical protein NG665_03550 [Arcanobacterium pinnipediorum]